MGTRHLTAVMLEGVYKVAQYGQWDGGPEGQGMTIRNFLRAMNKDRFKDGVKRCRFLLQKTIDAAWKKFGADDAGRISVDKAKIFSQHYPELSRDTGAGILQLIQDTGAGILQLIQDMGGLGLQNSLEFAQDSLFCEWAYVVDLDADTFEVYKGFNTEPLMTVDRFYDEKFKPDTKSNPVYYPVKLFKNYSLNDLPSPEAFLRDFQSNEDSTLVEQVTLLKPPRKINWR